MIKIIFHDKEVILNIEEYVKVSTLLKGYDFPMPCGGSGRCLKCKVKVKGDISPLSDTEIKNLTQREINDNIRLACFTKIKSGEIYMDYSDVVVLKDDVKYSSVKSDNLGIAIDIGTTTVAAYLYDIESKNILDVKGEANVLSSFGSDVISRVHYGVKHGTQLMSDLLINQAENLIASFGNYKDIKIVVTGNTVMLSILANKNLKGFSAYPFTPETLFDTTLNIKGRNIYFPPAISAFVGSDVYCGILSSHLDEYENALFIDMGTNGEIVLKAKDKYYSASAAAGPAFEGAGLANGVMGKRGAIYKVFSDGLNIKYKTINDGSPCGICGSGVCDLISLFIKYKVIDEYGNLKEEGHPFSSLIVDDRFYIGESGIYITKDDIRKITVAKSAVISAIYTVIEESKIKISDIEKFLIGGGFGNYIDLNSAFNMGLFPKELKGCEELCGNTAVKGAILILNNDFRKKEFVFSSVDVSTSTFFQKIFIDNMKY